MPYLLLLLLLAAPVMSGEAPADPAAMQREIYALFSAGDYAKAETLCERLVALQPTDAEASYNLACAQARLGKADPAITSLERSMELGFSDGLHAQTDVDLATLRQRPEFNRLVEAMIAKTPIEAGAPIPGMRTVENAPAGGLRYRLRIGEAASAEQPHRLVLWLHPSGGSGNRRVEALAPALAEHGFALAVFTQKQYRGWTDDEQNRLAATVADIAKQTDVDAVRPVLMGFSAGGQAALMLLQGKPGIWGGAMMCAAYPIIGENMDPMPAPAGAGGVPILAIIGGVDGGGNAEIVWKRIAAEWTKAGIPLTITVVPDRGHEFLFTGDAWIAALKWLDALPKNPPR